MRATRVRWLRAAACVLAVCAAQQPAPARAGTAVRPELITFKGYGGVFTIRPDGTGRRKLRTNADEPVWSRDGARIMYTAGVFRDDGLWTMRADGEARRLIVEPDNPGFGTPRPSEVTSGAWSPDGRMVAFAARFGSDEGATHVEIWSIGVDGTGLRRLGAGSQPEWSPDGRLIAFTPDGDPDTLSNRLAVMAPDGRGVRMLLDNVYGYRHSLDFSPDSRTLAFVEMGAGVSVTEETNVRTVDLRTGRRTLIRQSRTGRVFAATWAPGGKRIAFAGHAVVFDPEPRFVGPRFVSTIRPDGRVLRRVFSLPATGPQHIQTLSWRPRR